METRRIHRTWVWLGVIFLLLGLLGHVLAARAIGATYIAFRDHLFGFVAILFVTGAIIAVLGRFLWRGRYDITMLSIGVVQALVGLLVYIERFSVHG